MLMMDRITEISMDGGEFGKGHIIGELDITPSLWFFNCHFPGDPVMPGCLGLDAMWQMIGVLAELERSLISERNCAGVKDAQRRGVKCGRKRKPTPQQIVHARKLIDNGDRREDVAALLRVARTTLCRAFVA